MIVIKVLSLRALIYGGRNLLKILNRPKKSNRKPDRQRTEIILGANPSLIFAVLFVAVVLLLIAIYVTKTDVKQPVVLSLLSNPAFLSSQPRTILSIPLFRKARCYNKAVPNQGMLFFLLLRLSCFYYMEASSFENRCERV